jgi:predicted DNA-binding transcriptional regulator YafY
VVVRIAPEAAAEARERWGPAAAARPDGSVHVTLQTTPSEHLLGMVLGWGGAAEILSPPDVRQALRARVEALRARYR